MASLSLKISLEGGRVVKTLQFEPSTTVYDACRLIRDKILEAAHGDPKEFGLFLACEDEGRRGVWLEPGRALDYYMLRSGDTLHYHTKMRSLRVRMLDGTVKTMMVDDSQVVANLMVVICTKIGITNYDEYGLIREEQKEEPDPCEKGNYGTLTLKRKHQEKERDAKMDQLRKKLRTDDEVKWVEGGKTLREQGVEAGETLLLRRKLFYSDRCVDARDPVQLNLLYVQARDDILSGTHPVTHDKACEFAGLQCQVQFGDHRDDKHTPGFLDLKEFLPASYVKVKGIEKKVLKEHRKHAGLSELDAKVLYTKSARDLPTYGVAFFLVKEKMKGKNKLVPRLLGVTKDSVLRLDERTKEILQTWPLTTVRRWCASPNTFTLDFGDYSDQYYSVQTTEAEQILQVIAGYIDIIVRKRRAAGRFAHAADDEAAMLEDSVSPNRANIIQHDTLKSGKVTTESLAKPAVLRPGADGAKPFAVGHVVSAQHTTISGQIHTGHAPPATSQGQQTKVVSVTSEPQRALLSTITVGREVIERTERTLTRASLPELDASAASAQWKAAALDTSRQAVTSRLAAMSAATAHVVTLTSTTEETDHTAVGAAITTITTNLPEMTKGVQMIAALMDDSDNGDRLLDATRQLCTAFTDLLKAAEPETKEPRQTLLNAASRVGEASTSVLHTIGEESEEDKETQVTRLVKRSHPYRDLLARCYSNFQNAIFKDKDRNDFGGNCEVNEVNVNDNRVNDATDDGLNENDDGIYEDVVVSRVCGGKLEAIREESDSDVGSLARANIFDDKQNNTIDAANKDNINLKIDDCQKFMDYKTNKKSGLTKKDYSNHTYENVNFDSNKMANHNVNFASNIYTCASNPRNHFGNTNDKIKQIECHSIGNKVTNTGGDVKVSGALNLKLFDLDKYNRVLTTTETFVERSVSTTTNNYRDDSIERFLEKRAKHCSDLEQDFKTKIESGKNAKGKTEIRIVYNPTFETNVNKFESYHLSKIDKNRFCPNNPKEKEGLQLFWEEHWLNVLCLIGLLLAALAMLVQWCNNFSSENCTD